LDTPELTYPLRAYVCHQCWLVQVPAHASASELFTDDYAYFSSVSSSWVEHARKYSQAICERLELKSSSFVVEVASNDGYLLQFFQQADIPCLGIEPTRSTANAARERGIDTEEAFFGSDFATRLRETRGPADLLVGNNVLAHVPDLNDFVSGIAAILAPNGVATLEFPHLMRLVDGVQFDTIYHEHYSYLSFHTARQILQQHGLKVFDVEELETHGGSLRVYATPASSIHEPTPNVDALLATEAEKRLTSSEYYTGFQSQVDRIKDELLQWLAKLKASGVAVAGYGAAAKGNTLLNYAGVGTDLLPFICDAAPSKQFKFMPGSHIPILPPASLEQSQITHVLLLPWNIQRELRSVIMGLASSCEVTATAIPHLSERPLRGQLES
jgi:SAM-dependent methyltransferase